MIILSYLSYMKNITWYLRAFILINYYVRQNEITIELNNDYTLLITKVLADFEEKIYTIGLEKSKEEKTNNENFENKILFLKQDLIIGKLLGENMDLKEENLV